jgi:hypothetical protein
VDLNPNYHDYLLATSPTPFARAATSRCHRCLVRIRTVATSTKASSPQYYACSFFLPLMRDVKKNKIDVLLLGCMWISPSSSQSAFHFHSSPAHIYIYIYIYMCVCREMRDSRELPCCIWLGRVLFL